MKLKVRAASFSLLLVALSSLTAQGINPEVVRLNKLGGELQKRAIGSRPSVTTCMLWTLVSSQRRATQWQLYTKTWVTYMRPGVVMRMPRNNTGSFMTY
jgi:hypothetical protein